MNRITAFIRCLVFCPLAIAHPAFAQQTPAANLDDAWPRVCANPAPGSAFADRCADILNTGPGSGDRRSDAAIGSNLELNAAQHRVASDQRGDERDGARNEEQEQKLWVTERTAASFNASGNRLERDDSPFEAGFESTAVALQLMLDYRVSDDLYWGLSLGWLDADTDFKGRNSDLQSEYYRVTAILGYSPGADWWLDLYAGYALGELETTRATNFDLAVPATDSIISIRGVARGATDTDQVSFGIGGGRAWFFNETELSIGVNLDYLDFTADAYSETDRQGLAFAYAKSDYQSLTATLGINLAWPKSLDSGVLVPQIRIDYQYEFDDDASETEVRFVGDAGNEQISVGTEQPDRSALYLSAGVQWVLANSLSLYAEYGRRFEHRFLDEETLALGIRLAF